MASAPSIPGATRWLQSVSIAPCEPCAMRDWSYRVIAAAGCLSPTPRNASRRGTTTAGRSMRPRRWARRAWYWWSAVCRNIRGRAARLQRISEKHGRKFTTPSPNCLIMQSRRNCRWRSNRCIRPMPPIAPASTPQGRRSTSAMRSIPSAAARLVWRWTSITSAPDARAAARGSACPRYCVRRQYSCHALSAAIDGPRSGDKARSRCSAIAASLSPMPRRMNSQSCRSRSTALSYVRHGMDGSRTNAAISTV